MDDIKNIIAKNIADLRIQNNLTQLELAQKLNYSDKAISKWERGESLPDVTVLCEIAKLFCVPLDALVTETNIKKSIPKKYNYRIIKFITEGAVWTVALFCFVLTILIIGKVGFSWLYFIYALPISLIDSLVFNSLWFNKRKNYLIVSGIIWSILLAVQLTFLYFGKKIFLIYLLGVAGEIILILWSYIKPKK